MIGYFALLFALLLTGIAAVSYLIGHLRKGASNIEKFESENKAHRWYKAAALLVFVAAMHFLYIILDNRFNYAYVYNYSSLDLPFAYKLSAFWAGQEGSFLLWLVFHIVFGLLILRKKDMSGIMAVYTLLQFSLLGILLIQNPFAVLVEPEMDGRGLNPLLQDPWMVIHPPIVFLGYAALAVPFSYALGGLLSAKHENWIKEALPWALFACATLGAGIFIGGYWAYKVLGWGGYWAWDPVENASLVPWLVSVSLLHLLLLARKRPAAIAASYIAAIFSFGLVLYGTFLTRSGVLSDFSTHSFADVGIGGMLGAFIVITMAAALGILLWRWSSLPGGELYPEAASREFILIGTALVFAVFAALVLIGMSTPLITMLSGNPQNVSTSFYNSTSLPIAVAMMVLLTVGPKLKWGFTKLTLKEFLGIGSIAVLAVVAAISLGLYHPIMLLVIGCSFTALMANSIPAIRKNGMDISACVAHMGVAIAVIGIIASSAGGKSVTESLEKGTAKELLGAKITYLGTETTADGKGYHQNFKVEEKQTYILQSLTKLNKDGKAAAREPGIHRSLLGDLYLAPVMQHNQDIGNELALRKGEQKSGEGLTVKFINFGMNNDGNGDIRVFAQLEVIKDGVMQEVRPELIARNGQLQPIPVKAFDQYQIMLSAVSTREGAVNVAVRDLSRTVPESMSVEVSYKPLVSLVWLGVFLITIGTGWAVAKRIWGSEASASATLQKSQLN